MLAQHWGEGVPEDWHYRAQCRYESLISQVKWVGHVFWWPQKPTCVSVGYSWCIARLLPYYTSLYLEIFQEGESNHMKCIEMYYIIIYIAYILEYSWLCVMRSRLYCTLAATFKWNHPLLDFDETICIKTRLKKDCSNLMSTEEMGCTYSNLRWNCHSGPCFLGT